MLGRWREVVEQQHRRERVALGKAHFEEVRAIEAAGGRCLPASHGRIGETGRGSGSGGRVVIRRSLRFLGRRVEGPVARFGREAGAGSEGRGRGGLPRAEADQGQGVAAVHSAAGARQAAAPWAGARARRRVRAMTLAPAVLPPPLWSRTVPQLHARRWLPRLLAFTTKAPIVRGSRSGLSADPPCPDRDVSGHRGTGWSSHPYAGWRQTPNRGPVHVEAGSAADVGVFPRASRR